MTRLSRVGWTDLLYARRRPDDDVEARREGESRRRRRERDTGGARHRIRLNLGTSGLERPLMVVNFSSVNTCCVIDRVKAIPLGKPMIDCARFSETDRPRWPIAYAQLGSSPAR